MARYHVDHVTAFAAFPDRNTLILAFRTADDCLSGHTRTDRVAISMDPDQQWLLKRILEAKFDGFTTCTNLDRTLARYQPDLSPLRAMSPEEYPDHPDPRPHHEGPLRLLASYAGFPVYPLLPFDTGPSGKAHYNPVCISAGFSHLSFQCDWEDMSFPLDADLHAAIYAAVQDAPQPNPCRYQRRR
jgi:hypothetical protein